MNQHGRGGGVAEEDGELFSRYGYEDIRIGSENVSQIDVSRAREIYRNDIY